MDTVNNSDAAIRALVEQLDKERTERRNAEETARKAQESERKIRERANMAGHLCLENIGDLEARLLDSTSQVVSLRAIINALQRQKAERIELQ